MINRIIVACSVLSLTAGSAAFAQVPIFVDVNAPGPVHDGSSWERSFTELQPAINLAATTGERVLVADGTYYPTEFFQPPSNNSMDARALAFIVPGGSVPVRIHGGYKGYIPNVATSEDPNTPDGKFKDTILDGLIPGPGTYVWHVVVIDGTGTTTLPPDIVIDGFRVIRGQAIATSVFDPPHANHGAGLYVNLHDDTGVNVWLENLIVENNYAKGQGGGLYSASRKGAQDLHNVRVRHCTFRNNMANRGAAIGVNAGALLICSSSIYENGSATPMGPASPPIATDYGGGIALQAETEIRATNVLLYDNEAQLGGASSWEGDTNDTPLAHEWRNCTITDNRTNQDNPGVGGLYFVGGRTTFSGVSYTRTVEIQNSIVWGNEGIDILAIKGLLSLDVGVALLAEHSDIGLADGSALGNPAGQFVIDPMLNLSEDPMFVNASNSNCKLRHDIPNFGNTSPCVDAGVDSERGLDFADLNDNGILIEVLPNDIRDVDLLRSLPFGKPVLGVARLIDAATANAPPFGQNIDMGAYEVNRGAVMFP